LLDCDISLTRLDNGKSAILNYDPSSVAPAAEMGQLFGKVANHKASQVETVKFGELWQDRVQAILNNQNLVSCIMK
jgi:hypothetical protein